MKIVLTRSMREKKKEKIPPVTECEIRECFANREGGFLIDGRAKNLTNPVTRWFVAETNHGRKLKVCFIPMVTGDLVIKTAYEPDDTEMSIYSKEGCKHD